MQLETSSPSRSQRWSHGVPSSLERMQDASESSGDIPTELPDLKPKGDSHHVPGDGGTCVHRGRDAGPCERQGKTELVRLDEGDAILRCRRDLPLLGVGDVHRHGVGRTSSPCRTTPKRQTARAGVHGHQGSREAEGGRAGLYVLEIDDASDLREVLDIRGRTFHMTRACEYETCRRLTERYLSKMRATQVEGMRGPTINEIRRFDRELFETILTWVAKSQGTIKDGLQHYLAIAGAPDCIHARPGQGEAHQGEQKGTRDAWGKGWREEDSPVRGEYSWPEEGRESSAECQDVHCLRQAPWAKVRHPSTLPKGSPRKGKSQKGGRETSREAWRQGESSLGTAPPGLSRPEAERGRRHPHERGSSEKKEEGSRTMGSVPGSGCFHHAWWIR